ncbi:MAG: hypothetical protein ACRD3Q_21740, partial [Terriglobales bacterium]
MANDVPPVQPVSSVHEKRKHFHHNAHAVAFAGHITAPFDQLIEAQASCALPISGGHASNRVDNYNLKDLITFKAAYCTVTGNYSEQDDAFFTVVSTTVEELNFLGMVKVGLVSGRVMCKHPYADPKNPPKQPVEPSIQTLGSHYDNVRIG